jgi:hypothetical protein
MTKVRKNYQEEFCMKINYIELQPYDRSFAQMIIFTAKIGVNNKKINLYGHTVGGIFL